MKIPEISDNQATKLFINRILTSPFHLNAENKNR
jgi:hypothetical protein